LVAVGSRWTAGNAMLWELLSWIDTGRDGRTQGARMAIFAAADKARCREGIRIRRTGEKG
jgi:hypothetical protein